MGKWWLSPATSQSNQLIQGKNQEVLPGILPCLSGPFNSCGIRVRNPWMGGLGDGRVLIDCSTIILINTYIIIYICVCVCSHLYSSIYLCWLRFTIMIVLEYVLALIFILVSDIFISIMFMFVLYILYLYSSLPIFTFIFLHMSMYIYILNYMLYIYIQLWHVMTRTRPGNTQQLCSWMVIRSQKRCWAGGPAGTICRLGGLPFLFRQIWALGRSWKLQIWASLWKD